MLAVRRVGASLLVALWVSIRGGWVGSARLVGRYHTVLSVVGAAFAIWFGALRQVTPVVGAPGSSPESTALRVCADPRNPVYSSFHGEGFENELAQLLGRGLDAQVTYSRLSQRPNAFDNRLITGDCDVLMGVPSSIDMVLTTRDEELRDKLDALLTEHEADIDALLARYSVPRWTSAQRRAQLSER